MKILIVALAVLALSAPTPAQDRGDELKSSICDNLLRTGQLDAALQCYLQLLEADAANPVINLRICQILEAQGQADKLEPYLSRIDKSSPEGSGFVSALSLNYGTLKIGCRGQTGCPFFFMGKTGISFTPPEDLEPSKTARLSIINRNLRDGKLWFQKEGPGLASASIPYFPVVTSSPLPYDVGIADRTENLDYNFVSRTDLELTPADFDSVYCGVPDSMAEFRVEIDDPEFEAVFHQAAGSPAMLSEDGRFYATRGGISSLEFERKGRPGINKKYLVVTSVVLTAAMVFLQR